MSAHMSALLPVPPCLPVLAPELESALLDTAQAVHTQGARLWLVGESALAAQLGLAQARVTFALRAHSPVAAQAAFAAAREALRRTPRRPQLRRIGERGALEADLLALDASDAGPGFALELAAAGLAPLCYALEPLRGVWFDPTSIQARIGAGRLPLPSADTTADALAWLRRCGLATWAGLEFEPGPGAESGTTLPSTPAQGSSAWREPAQAALGIELHAWAARAGAGAALRRFGTAAAERCGLVAPGDETWALRLSVLESLEAGARSGPGLLAALCVLADPLHAETKAPEAWQEARERMDACGIEPSLRTAVVQTWRLAAQFERLQQRARERGFEGLHQAERIRLVREPAWPLVARLARAWTEVVTTTAGERVELAQLVDALDLFRADFEPHELHPRGLLAIGDLINARIPRGTASRELLEEALDLQLDGVLATREAAVSWLHARALDLALGERAQLGGKIRRRKKDSG
jgi:hypothetical protein